MCRKYFFLQIYYFDEIYEVRNDKIFYINKKRNKSRIYDQNLVEVKKQTEKENKKIDKQDFLPYS